MGKSIKEQDEIDCKSNRYRQLKIAHYSGEMATGNVIFTTDTPDMDWDGYKDAKFHIAKIKKMACGK